MANEQNLNPWKKGQSGNPNGRPPKLISQINKELSEAGFKPANKQDFIDAYTQLVQLPTKELEDIADPKKHKELPYFYKLIAKELTGKRGGEALERILDRAIGKAKQDVSVGGSIKVTERIKKVEIVRTNKDVKGEK